MGGEWLVIFIPVKIGLTYNVLNFGGADGNREACMVDINLNYCHSITTSNNQITAQKDDAYLAVSYGSEVTTDTTYYIDYNPLLSNNKITKLVNDLELKTLLYKEKQFTKGEVDGNLLINDTALRYINIGDSLIIIAFSDIQINATLNSVVRYTDGSSDYNINLDFGNSNIVTLEKEFNKNISSLEWGFGNSSPETCKITILVGLKNNIGLKTLFDISKNYINTKEYIYTKTFDNSNREITFNYEIPTDKVMLIKAYTNNVEFDLTMDAYYGPNIFAPKLAFYHGEARIIVQQNQEITIQRFAFKDGELQNSIDVTFCLKIVDSNSLEVNDFVKISPIDALPILNNSPLDIIKQEPGFATIIHDWGFIGDSLASGEMQCFEGSVQKFIDMYEYSWGQRLCALCGSEGYNFSYGGQTTKGWIESIREPDRCWEGAKSNIKQAYIIALGTNDRVQSYPVGDAETDIDIDDYNNNSETFAGYYGGIIQRIKSVQPRAIIFVATLANEGNNSSIPYNDQIRKMPNIFDNVFLIDRWVYCPKYAGDFRKNYYMNGHLNPAGYQWEAYMFATYIDWIIRKNYDKFIDCALIGTNYTANSN